MILKPLLSYEGGTSRVHASEDLLKQQKSRQGQFLIGFIELKKEQLSSLVDISFPKQPSMNVLAWISSQESIGHRNRVLYMPPSSEFSAFLRPQQRERVEQLVAKILISVSHVLVLDINSRHSKICPSVNQQKSPKVYYLMLSHTLGQVYRADLQKNISKLELNSKLNKQTLSLQTEHFLTQNKQIVKKDVSRILNSLTYTFQKVFYWKNLTSYEALFVYFKVLSSLKTHLNQEEPNFEELINQRTIQTHTSLKKIEQKIENFHTASIQNQPYLANCVRKDLLESLKKKNQICKWQYLQKVKLGELDKIQTFQEIQPKKELLRKRFEEYGIAGWWVECLASETQKRFLASQTRKLRTQIVEKDAQKQLLELQIRQQKNSAALLEQQIQEFNKKVFLYQSLNQQFLLSESNLQKERSKSRLLEVEIKASQIEINKKTESEKYLEKFIGHLLDEKSEFVKQIDTLKTANEKVEEINALQAQKIQQFRQKLTELNKLQDWAKQSIQNARTVENQLCNYHQWSHTLEQNYKAFKKIEIEKINYILKKNFTLYQSSVKKNQQLSEQVQQLQKERSEILKKMELQKTKCLYFQKQILRNMELSKEAVIEEQNAEYQITDRNLARVLSKINQNYESQVTNV